MSKAQTAVKEAPARYSVSVANAQGTPPGYKQTEVGVIPEAWKVKSFSGFCLLQRGFDITEATRIAGNVPVYSSSGLSYFHKQSIVNAPGVVTGRKGILGKVFYIEEPFWPHDTTLWVKDFKGNDPKYVYWYLTFFKLERFDAATSVPTLNRNNLVGIPVPVPPLPEQRAIAAALSDVDALIAALDKLITKKRAIKTAAMQQLLTGKQRLPGFRGEWIKTRLDDFCSFYSGGTPATSVREYYGGKIPWITSSDLNENQIYVVNGRITKAGLENSSAKMIKPNTLLIALYGATAGVVAISRIEAAINQAVLAIIPNRGSSEFLYHKLSSMKDQIVSTYTQGGQPNLSGEIVRAIEIDLPNQEEQTTIAIILSDMDAEIAALEARRNKTQAIKQGMMQELLTGRIRLV